MKSIKIKYIDISLHFDKYICTISLKWHQRETKTPVRIIAWNNA